MLDYFCPHCNKSAYGSYEDSKLEFETCIYCGKQFPNPYYKGGDEDK